MRISNKPKEIPEEIPLEVQLWLSRGWTIMETERRGVVLAGPKTMRGRTKLLIALGIILLCLFYFGPLWPGLGAAFLVVAILDYKVGTQAPTKFFPGKGEKNREMER